jgi:hypothetical protein
MVEAVSDEWVLVQTEALTSTLDAVGAGDGRLELGSTDAERRIGGGQRRRRRLRSSH